MSENRRVLRVEREIRQVLAEMLIHGLKIPLPGFASVVDVDASGDLRSARVFVRVAGTAKDREKAEQILLEQIGLIQREVAGQLQTKFCPKLKFIVGGASEGQIDEVEMMLANLNRRHYGDN